MSTLDDFAAHMAALPMYDQNRLTALSTAAALAWQHGQPKSIQVFLTSVYNLELRRLEFPSDIYSQYP